MIDILNKYKVIVTVVVCSLIFMTIVRQCEKEPKIVTKTVTKTITKRDTITKTIISEPKTVYVKKYVNVKGEDKIVYLEKQDASATEAKEYNTILQSNKSTANIKITTTGELLDVSGTITYPEKENTITITKSRAKSGLFVYGTAPLNTNNISIEVGMAYQFKNTLMIIGGVQYNDFTKSADLKVGIGVKIF
jgi:hypothetical protein